MSTVDGGHLATQMRGCEGERMIFQNVLQMFSVQTGDFSLALRVLWGREWFGLQPGQCSAEAPKARAVPVLVSGRSGPRARRAGSMNVFTAPELPDGFPCVCGSLPSKLMPVRPAL